MPKPLRILGLAAMLSVALIGTESMRVRASTHFIQTQTYEDVYYLPPAGWLSAFSLGYREALADLIWMRALIYFGDELMHHGAVQHAFDYTDAMLALAPHMRPAYSWIATSALYNTGGTVTAADAERVATYLERGTRMFPDDGDLEWQLGATYTYELPPMLNDPAAKERARRRGLPHLQRAARMGAGPPWLALTNAQALVRLGQREQAVRHLEEMYATVQDEDARDQIAARISHLRTEAYAEAFERANQDAEQARQRDFPYLSPTMYLLVGPRQTAQNDALLRRNFRPADMDARNANDAP
ncbi:MAG: hypothetical protein IPK60_01420 [Sandaracinaceae bacterium]|nr:hypothetical protein [Sandaracinaceae bacterium]